MDIISNDKCAFGNANSFTNSAKKDDRISSRKLNKKNSKIKRDNLKIQSKSEENSYPDISGGSARQSGDQFMKKTWNCNLNCKDQTQLESRYHLVLGL